MLVQDGSVEFPCCSNRSHSVSLRVIFIGVLLITFWLGAVFVDWLLFVPSVFFVICGFLWFLEIPRDIRSVRLATAVRGLREWIFLFGAPTRVRSGIGGDWLFFPFEVVLGRCGSWS